MRETQIQVFKDRLAILRQADEKDSFELTKPYIETLLDQLHKLNDSTQSQYDSYVQELKKDMENSYEDMDIVLSDFKDFLIKNDAELPEG